MRRSNKLALKIAIATICANALTIFGVGYASVIMPDESSDNTVTITSDSYTITHEGQADVNESVADNIELVYGGAWQDFSSSGNSNYNVVNILGGTFGTTAGYYDADGSIYGGYSLNGNAMGNVINVGSLSMTNGSSINMSGTILYGGYSNNGSSSNNILNVYTLNAHVGNISGFNTINFYIPASATNGSLMLRIGDYESTVATDLSGVTINAGVVSGSSLAQGDTITLMRNGNQGITTDSSTTYGTLSEGVSNSYALSIALVRTGHLSSQQSVMLPTMIHRAILHPVVILRRAELFSNRQN